MELYIIGFDLEIKDCFGVILIISLHLSVKPHVKGMTAKFAKFAC